MDLCWKTVLALWASQDPPLGEPAGVSLFLLRQVPSLESVVSCPCLTPPWKSSPPFASKTLDAPPPCYAWLPQKGIECCCCHLWARDAIHTITHVSALFVVLCGLLKDCALNPFQTTVQPVIAALRNAGDIDNKCGEFNTASSPHGLHFHGFATRTRILLPLLSSPLFLHLALLSSEGYSTFRITSTHPGRSCTLESCPRAPFCDDARLPLSPSAHRNDESLFERR